MISNFKQRLILSYLFVLFLIISIWSYNNAFFSDINSLQYNYALLLLLIPTFLFSFNGFVNYIIHSIPYDWAHNI